ncbi:MAG: hypothetical protein IKU47_03475 [Oscillospiraceae bacterium]|nr:hypothetical protein [Oscillospiraceae bacterium]
MKESTVIFNAQFTYIRKHADDVALELDNQYIEKELGRATNADDVLVTDAKVFESEGNANG